MIYNIIDTFYLLPEQLENSPSRKEGVDRQTETTLRLYGTELIQEAGILLKLPQVVMATGQVLFHRFYCKRSFTRYNVKRVSASCVWLAAKLEEAPRKIRDVLFVFYRMNQRREGLPLEALEQFSKTYDELRTELIRTERHLLKEMGFICHVEHPHKFLFNYLEQLEVSDPSVRQRAWSLANDSLRTTLCVQFKSEVVACGVIYIATRQAQIPLPENPPWWLAFDATKPELDEICRVLADLYRRPKASYVEVGRDAKSFVLTSRAWEPAQDVKTLPGVLSGQQAESKATPTPEGQKKTSEAPAGAIAGDPGADGGKGADSGAVTRTALTEVKQPAEVARASPGAVQQAEKVVSPTSAAVLPKRKERVVKAAEEQTGGKEEVKGKGEKRVREEEEGDDEDAVEVRRLLKDRLGPPRNGVSETTPPPAGSRKRKEGRGGSGGSDGVGDNALAEEERLRKKLKEAQARRLREKREAQERERERESQAVDTKDGYRGSRKRDRDGEDLESERRIASGDGSGGSDGDSDEDDEGQKKRMKSQEERARERRQAWERERERAEREREREKREDRERGRGRDVDRGMEDRRTRDNGRGRDGGGDYRKPFGDADRRVGRGGSDDENDMADRDRNRSGGAGPVFKPRYAPSGRGGDRGRSGRPDSFRGGHRDPYVGRSGRVSSR